MYYRIPFQTCLSWNASLHLISSHSWACSFFLSLPRSSSRLPHPALLGESHTHPAARGTQTHAWRRHICTTRLLCLLQKCLCPETRACRTYCCWRSGCRKETCTAPLLWVLGYFLPVQRRDTPFLFSGMNWLYLWWVCGYFDAFSSVSKEHSFMVSPFLCLLSIQSDPTLPRPLTLRINTAFFPNTLTASRMLQREKHKWANK